MDIPAPAGRARAHIAAAGRRVILDCRECFLSRGEIRLQVEGFSCTRLFILVLGSGILLGAASGCHRPPAPDVMATVNGKEITRAELDKYYKSTVGDAPQEPSAEQADIVRLNILKG